MKHFVLWVKVVLVGLLMLPGRTHAQEVTLSGGREPNQYTATVTPGVVANTGQPVPVSLTLINVTPEGHKGGGCGDDHDDGGCGGGSDKASGPGSMAIKKITLWLPQGISTADLQNIGYYTMPCGRQWTRTELDATDRIVFVAQHGRDHRLGRDQAFVLTFDLLTSFTGQLQWMTTLSHCPGKGGRAFQLVTLPGNQPTENHPLTVLYAPGKEQLAGGGMILASQPHGSHAPAPGTEVHFTLNAKYQQEGKNTGLKGHATLEYYDATGTRWTFLADEPLALGINTRFEPGVAAATFAARGQLMAGSVLLHEVVLQATLTDRGEPGKWDEAGFTLRHDNTLLLSTHWQDKTTLRAPLSGGNIIIIGGGTQAGVGVLNAHAPGIHDLIMPLQDQPLTGLTTWPNPFSQRLHFRFTPAEDTHVLLQLYDLSGRLITTLMDEHSPGGQPCQVEYVPQGQKPGMMIYRLTLGTKVQTGRVMYQ